MRIPVDGKARWRRGTHDGGELLQYPSSLIQRLDSLIVHDALE